MKKSLFLVMLVFLISLTPGNAQDSVLLIKNIRYIDVEKGVEKKGDIMIRSGKIERIAVDIKSSPGSREIDGSGKWLIPGLVDAHIHLFQSGSIYTRPDVVDLTAFRDYPTERAWVKENAGDLLKRYLRCGITTVIDVGGPFVNFEIRDKYSDITQFPNLFLTGPLISTYQPEAFKIEDPPIIKVNTVEEAVALVQKQLPYRPDFIKIWYIALRDKPADSTYHIIAATIEESHKNGLKVAVHATELNTARLALKAGADILVHSVDEPLDDDFIALLKKRNVVYIPTMIVHGNYVASFLQEVAMSKEDFFYSNPVVLGSFFDPRHFPAGNVFEKFELRRSKMKEGLALDENVREANLKLLGSQPVLITTGTDAGNIGTLHATSYYPEIAAMKKAGLTNAQILTASTINGAKMLGKENMFGSIEAGKMADLVILNANPLEDIGAIKDIQYVIKGGNLIAAADILKETPENLVQQQVNGYNARNIDAFLEPYSEEVELYNFPDQLIGKGKEKIRPGYAGMFEKSPELHCEIVSRISLGNTVIDHERVTGIPGLEVLEAMAIYKIENGKIAKVYFVDKE